LKWLQARDELYEEIMEKAWNPEGKYFGQSYDENRVLDSAVLIMPLVFFEDVPYSDSPPLRPSAPAAKESDQALIDQ